MTKHNRRLLIQVIRMLAWMQGCAASPEMTESEAKALEATKHAMDTVEVIHEYLPSEAEVTRVLEILGMLDNGGLRKQLMRTKVAVTTSQGIETLCQLTNSDTIWGCFQPYRWDHVWVKNTVTLDKDIRRTIRHELMHKALYIVGGNHNPEHDLDLWKDKSL